jgi:hypothetical protein
MFDKLTGGVVDSLPGIFASSNTTQKNYSNVRSGGSVTYPTSFNGMRFE